MEERAAGRPGWFPIAVWLQVPANAPKFKAAGINCYVGLWEGPTEKQLAALKAPQMPVICDQNETGLKHKDDPIIIGWMHGDEPDNAQALQEGEGYGPPVRPKEIIKSYRRMRKTDPSRPVMLNLGQGVAWDDWYGRGVRTNHPEDYSEYVQGCDIASFDIYPVVHDHPDVAGKLEFVPKGVTRLKKWAGPDRIVWNCIEASRISNTQVKPTPEQIRSEVWMAIIRGSRGLIYFVHQFEPRFVEASLLEDKELLAGVTAVNRQVTELAPVINSPYLARAVEVDSSAPGVPIELMARKWQGAVYLFAAAVGPHPTTGSFNLNRPAGKTKVTALGESRELEVAGGRFKDEFPGYGVHIYKVE